MSELLTWFGDDFTGSSDVLLQYTRAGVPALLFLGTPTATELHAAAEKYQAIGIAGLTRAMRTPEIGPVVQEAFELLATLDPRVLQYKICSTADSSVEVGSIAPAVRIGRDMFGARPVPILPAQPDLGRYTVFGNHFGRDVTGVHRLDRLPSMAHHPVTPMTEADLRRHFAAQLATEVGGLPITALRIGDGARVLQELSEEGRVAFVMDALDNDDLHAAAQLLLAELDGVLFAVGSGGLSVGLAAVRTASRPVADTAAGPKPGTCLVVSGSAAGRTSDQIDAAVAAGWTALPLDPARLSTDAEAREAVAELGKTASDAFGKSPGVIVYTAHRDSLPPTSAVPSNAVGAALGDVILAVRRRTNVSRVLLAGGDTSGYVLTRLRATTLSATGAVGSDLVLGTVTSLDEDINGLEVVLKGGQLGHLDVFESALETRAASST